MKLAINRFFIPEAVATCDDEAMTESNTEVIDVTISAEQLGFADTGYIAHLSDGTTRPATREEAIRFGIEPSPSPSLAD